MQQQPHETAPTLEAIRRSIDGIDRRIVALIAERQHLVVAAGARKRDEQHVRAPDRVERVIAHVRALAAGLGASGDVVERTYRAMIAGFVDLELDRHRASAARAQGDEG